MKKKMIMIEIVLLLVIGAYAIYANWAKQPKRVEFDDIIAEIYFGDQAEIIVESSFSIDDARTYDLPGLNDDVLDLFEKVEIKLDPTQQMKMIYASLHGIDMLVYFVEFVRRDAKLGEYVHIVTNPLDISYEDIILSLEEAELSDISEALSEKAFSIAHHNTTQLQSVSTAMGSFINNNMKGVLFFEFHDLDAVLFIYHENIYLVTTQNGEYVIVYPEPMSFNDLMGN